MNTFTVSKQDIYGTMNPEIPKGYREVGFRFAKYGEDFLSLTGPEVRNSKFVETFSPRIILEKGSPPPTHLDMRFKVVGLQKEPKIGQFGYNPINGYLVAGIDTSDSWEYVLEFEKKLDPDKDEIK